METPLLYRQLQEQLRQWVQPKDQRHLGSGLDLWIGSDIYTKLVAVDEQTNDNIV